MVFGSGTGDLSDVYENPDYKSVYDQNYLQNMTNVSLDTLLNDAGTSNRGNLKLEALFASESTEPDFEPSLTERSSSVDLKKIVSKRELELVRVRYDLEI